METMLVLKAVADETRMKIIKLLLSNSYCVRGLSRRLELSEAAVSQHLKVLKEAGIVTGEKKSYYMHYEVNRDILKELSAYINDLSAIELARCTSAEGGCTQTEQKRCQNGEPHADE